MKILELFSKISIALLLLSTAANAHEVKPKTDAQIAKELKTFLEEHPQLPRRVEAGTQNQITVPRSVLEEIEHGFQKRMAMTGHGAVWDSNGREVEIGIDEAFELQAEMLAAIEKEKPAALDGQRQAHERLAKIVGELDAAASEFDGDRLQTFAVQNLRLRAKAFALNPAIRSKYLWRANHLWRVVKRFEKIELDPRFQRIQDLLARIILALQTDYMRECAAAGVPVPPNFALQGTQWRYQGDLSAPMIISASRARVYAWAPPSGRGACLALPRGTGAPGTDDLAGIICQSADTGRACFWDSIRRGTTEVIAWRDEPMRIRELADANELANCTNCHQGNNVFILSPDDPTWCRLMRGGAMNAGCNPVNAANGQNFTLQVEQPINGVPVPNTSVVHPRYVPISSQGWSNSATLGCGATCHLNASGPPSPTPMPPMCGTACNQ